MIAARAAASTAKPFLHTPRAAGGLIQEREPYSVCHRSTATRHTKRAVKPFPKQYAAWMVGAAGIEPAT